MILPLEVDGVRAGLSGGRYDLLLDPAAAPGGCGGPGEYGRDARAAFLPAPATHAILTQWKAGETVYQGDKLVLVVIWLPAFSIFSLSPFLRFEDWTAQHQAHHIDSKSVLDVLCRVKKCLDTPSSV